MDRVSIKCHVPYNVPIKRCTDSASLASTAQGNPYRFLSLARNGAQRDLINQLRRCGSRSGNETSTSKANYAEKFLMNTKAEWDAKLKQLENAQIAASRREVQRRIRYMEEHGRTGGSSYPEWDEVPRERLKLEGVPHSTCSRKRIVVPNRQS
jgi:hypothetical protein